MSERASSRRWIGASALLVIPLLIAWQSATTASNEARLAALSPSQLADLRRKKELFDGMTANDQSRLRDFDQRLHAEPNPDELLAIWKDYNRWLGGLDAQTRMSIIQVPDVTQRVAAISRVVAQRRQRNFGLASEDRLPEGDLPAFRSWLQETGKSRLSELRQSMPSLPREFDPNDRRMLRTAILQRLDDDDFRRLADKLSPVGAAILNRKADREEKTRLVIAWWISTFLQIPADELQRFLKELPSATRLYIEQLGPEQGQQELKRRYLDDLRRRQQ